MRITVLRSGLAALITASGIALLSAAAPAFALTEGPGWELSANTYPTNLLPSKTPGETSGTIAIDVFNIGAAASGGTITVTDTLPNGLYAQEAGELKNGGEGFGIGWGIRPKIGHAEWDCTGNGPGGYPAVAGATVVTCVNNPAGLASFQGGGGVPETQGVSPQPPVGIAVEAAQEASGLVNHVSIAGGGAPAPASTENPVTVSSTPAKGGLTGWDAWFSNADGTIDTQAGSHPYEMTTVFDLATAINSEEEGVLVSGEVRDLEVQLPPGFIGDTLAVPECTRTQLSGGGEHGACPAASAVGILQAGTTSFPIQHPVYNMVPPPGEPAEFGVKIDGVISYFDFSVRTGGDDGITVRINNIAQRIVQQGILTLWGTPEERSHNRWRTGQDGGCSQEEMEHGPTNGYEESYCSAQQYPEVKALLTLPTSCGEAEPAFLIHDLSSWQDPAAESELTTTLRDSIGRSTSFTGCEDLAFNPQVTTSPDTGKSDTPTGLTVEVTPPVGGLEEPGLLGTADIKDTTVMLPAGLVINPGQAAGLQACLPGNVEGGDDLPLPGQNGEEEQFDGPAKCPGASKIGTVEINTPLIEGSEQKVMKGNVYVLQSDPPEIKLLVAASADGVNLKLIGTTSLCETVGEVLHGKSCEAPGQVIASFEDTPQLPFTLFKLSFSGGAQAALDTPAECGTYTSAADFTPWSAPFVSDFVTDASFSLTEGPDGLGCPSSPMPFSPSLTAGATTDQAGGFTSFSMLLQRGDGQQRIEKLSFTAPAGLSAMISQVPLCGEADANAGSCPSSTQIGHAVVTSGPGPYPLVVPQPGEPEAPIYLTGPYKGQPFGLSIVTPVIAGPFNLGTIITRGSIAVDPHTAQITITTDPLPQIVKGVPTDLREIDAVVDRPGFMFNPTNCNPQAFSGTATSTTGTTTAISSHFQVGSCQSLKFQPKFAVSIPGHASKADGSGLTAKLTYPAVEQGTDADVAKVKVDLPVQLPSQLKTLQKACVAAVFEANPANCPPDSIVGHATVHTPLLPVPLTGPAYFVSHAGAEFPSLTIVLQGYGVTVDLVGSTFISKAGITSTTFNTVPDVPFSSFELTLPQGEYAALGVNLPAKDQDNYCGQTLVMPTALIGQNGAEIHQNTPITVNGCSNTLSIRSQTINKQTLTLSIYAPAAGKLKASGKGLSTVPKTAKGRENITITLKQQHTGKLKTTVKVVFKPSKGKKQTKAAKLTLKE
jgi:hypothetical protein